MAWPPRSWRECGKTLLVPDTAGAAAERLYHGLGRQGVGAIPGLRLPSAGAHRDRGIFRTPFVAFIPNDFLPPRHVTTGGLRLEVLSPEHAEHDFAAIGVSAAQIERGFGPAHWWSPDIGFEQNLADLARHAREFEAREAFAYALRDAEGQAYLGCVYIRPMRPGSPAVAADERFQARVYFWLSGSHLWGRPLSGRPSAVDERQVLETLRAWLAADWPFAAVVFPGRSIGWAEWQALA
jgi:hypothetical protein